MKRAIVLFVLLMVILTVTTSVVSAKPGNKLNEVCWVTSDTRKGDENTEKRAYFMMTGSGIVHRFMDGRHDIYKPQEKFERPPGDGWIPWTAKAHDGCGTETATAAEIGDYLNAGDAYWHKGGGLNLSPTP